jgi:hypothetical protein
LKNSDTNHDQDSEQTQTQHPALTVWHWHDAITENANKAQTSSKIEN